MDILFFGARLSQVLYNLEALYPLLMPALDPTSKKAFGFQYNFIKTGEAGVIVDMLTKIKFLPNAEETTKRYLTVLKLFMLTIRAILKIAWIASTGNLNNVDVLHTMHEANQRDPRSIEANDILR
ncbi:hypothetical protein KQX54_003854 [Cotesia glomerata]|uniref:Uncharacterized protein n=1 Tax=Cotesia glomerata TaxID=32391 RepID=A0AAV7IZ96_COTGL|nr:hypothetical protein KQX54_003854 [Cotesia glomerata]